MPKKLSECEKGYRRWIGDALKPQCEACKSRPSTEKFTGQRMCEPCALYWKGFYGQIIVEDATD